MLKSLFPIVAATLATPAIAQEVPEDDSIVVTASRVPQDQREVGQAVTVITRDEIDARQTTLVSDLLATTPGVTVSRNGGVGGLTSLRIRGAESDQTLVVIDGVRVNDPSSTGGGFDFANLLSTSVERIEVLRGPNAVPWGSQAIGGVVNIITTTPQEGLQARAQAEYGYADTLFASGGVSGKSGAVSGALNGGYLRTDGISQVAIGSERDGYRQYGASGKLGIEIASNVSIDLRGYWADSKVQLDGYLPDFSLGDTSAYAKTQEFYGYAGLNATFGDFHNRVAFTIADIDRDNYDSATDTQPSSIGRGRSERYEYQGDYRVIDAVRLVAGLERENTRFADASARKTATGMTSVWGEAIVKPLSILTVTGGVRHDDHDTYGAYTTFGADAALALASGTTLRASYGEGFKAPTLFQLYSSSGNGNLRPETARNYDVGVEQHFLGGRAQVAVTYFNRVTRDQITFRSCTLAELADPTSACARAPFGGIYDNIQRTRANGVEFAVALRPVDALTFSANYTFIDAENRSADASYGDILLRRPRQLANVNADYRLPFGLSVGGTVSLVGDSYDISNDFNDPDGLALLDGYALASVRAELPIGKRFAVYGRVENLFDARYTVVDGYGTYGRAAYGGVRINL